MKNEREIGTTDRIYERDAYVKEFSATVLSCEKGDNNLYEIVLDLTAFFPEGGGQTSDTGVINDGHVVDVQIKEDNIIHYVDKEFTAGDVVYCKIDWQRRFRKMQNHSGEHLFCGLIHNAYGLDNVGFHMNDEEVTLDVNGELTKEQLYEIERKANEVIYENVPIVVSFPTKEECGSIEYRSKLDITEGIRLVTIEKYDVCACCAPHVLSTGQIGVIKIIDYFYHRGGTRVTLRSGISAYEDYALLDKANKGLVGLLSSKRYDTFEFAVRSDERYHELLEENIRLKKMFSEIESQNILEKMATRKEDDLTPELIFSESLDRVQMRTIINSITENYGIIVAGFIGNDESGYDYIIGRGVGNETNLSPFAKGLNEAFNGRGGGKPEMIQGHIGGTAQDIKIYFENN